MTKLNSSIKFNSSSGSDTLASGCGPSTAVYGSNATITSGSPIVAAIDTTGLSAGDLMWVDTASGRQFNVIDSVDSATQVTCGAAWDSSEAYANWAVGGKRATLDAASTLLTYSLQQAAEMELETDQSCGWTIKADQDLVIRSDSPSTVRTITQTSTYFLIGCDSVSLKDLIIKTNGSGTKYVFKHDLTYGNCRVRCDNVQFGDTGAEFYRVNDGNLLYARYLFMQAHNCVFITTNGFGTRLELSLKSCYFRGAAFGFNDQGQWVVDCADCIFDRTTSLWVDTTGVTNTGEYRSFRNCIFSRCGSLFGSKFIPSLGSIEQIGALEHCVFISCYLPSSSDCPTGGANNYYYNTTLPSHWRNSTSLSSDPLEDSANGDVNIDDSTAGNILRAVNDSRPNNTTVYRFRNLVTDSFGSGGGSVIVIED
jgi:hypothetical protein